jgi:hypothetical protein
MKPSCEEIAAILREYAEWADANIYEVPIMLPDDLRTAADMLEKGEWYGRCKVCERATPDVCSDGRTS